MDIYVALLKALLTLAGPATSYVRRRSGRRSLDELEGLLTSTDPLADEISRALARAATGADLGQRETIQLAGFCGSDVGQMSLRLICIARLGLTNLDVTPSLEMQVAAALRVYGRAVPEGRDMDAAKVIVATATDFIRPLISSIAKYNEPAAREIREIAFQQARVHDFHRLVDTQHRSRALELLADTLPSELDDQVTEYLQAVEGETSRLEIHGPRAVRELPIADSLVTPGVRRRDGGPIGNLSIVDKMSIIPPLLESSSRVLILGDPGGGKSTSVRAAINEFAVAALLRETHAVPFLITLRKYAAELRTHGDRGFTTYLWEKALSNHECSLSLPVLKFLLHTGRAIVFFDGLDEVLELDERRSVIAKIESFSRRYPQSSTVVTSREIGYDIAPLPSDFSPYVIQQFSPENVLAFATRFFEAAAVDDLDLSPQNLTMRFMDESKDLQTVRTNPLMLGILCYLFAAGRSLPVNRLELYREAASLLFETWDKNRGIKVELGDPSAARHAMRTVASAVFGSPSEEIAAPAIKQAVRDFYVSSRRKPDFEGESFADQVFEAWTGRKWLLAYAGEARNVAHYRFAHRTFLEFFAAEQTAYESETGVDAWNNIKDLVQRGAAAPYCQLVLQIMSEESAVAADRFYSAALDFIDQGGRVPAAKFGVLNFMCESWASVLPSEDVARRLVRSVVEFVADLVPWVTRSEVLEGYDRTYPGYMPVLEGSVWTRDEDAQRFQELQLGATNASEADSLSEDLTLDHVDIDAVSALLKAFHALPDAERELVLNELRATVRARLEDGSSPTKWVRMALFLYQVTYFEGWQNIDLEWRRSLAEVGTVLWGEVVTQKYAAESVASDDYWLALCLARDRASTEDGVISYLDTPGLFFGGWPLPVTNLRAGTVAHSLILSLLGVQCDAYLSDWVDAELDSLCSEIENWALRDDAFAFDELDPDDLETFGELEMLGSENRLTSSTRLFVLCWLARALAMCGDLEFLERAFRAYGANAALSPGAEAFARVMWRIDTGEDESLEILEHELTHDQLRRVLPEGVLELVEEQRAERLWLLRGPTDS